MRRAIFVVAVLSVLGLAAGLVVVLQGNEQALPSTLERGASGLDAEVGSQGGAGAELAARGGDGTDAVAEDERSIARSTERSIAPTWDPATTVWVEGRVVLPAGCPSGDATRVFAARGEHTAGVFGQRDVDSLLAEAELDDSGAFRIGLPPDATDVHLFAEGRYTYTVASTALALPVAEPVELEPALGGWVSGRVRVPRELDAAAELVGLTVRLQVDNDDSVGQMDRSAYAWREVAADGEGRFDFFGVAPRALQVVAIPRALAATALEGVEARAGERTDVELLVQRGATVRGRVVDDEDEVVPGATVVAVQDANFIAGRTGRRVREVAADGDGNFELVGVAAGVVSLRAETPGTLFVSERLELTAGETREDVTLRVTVGGTIAGKVLGPDGEPAGGAILTALFDMAQIGGMGGLNAIRGPFAWTYAEEDGTFRVTGLGKGPFVVEASAPPAGEAMPAAEPGRFPELDPLTSLKARAVGVSPGTEGLELRLEAPRVLAGSVVDTHGRPVTAFFVRAMTETRGLVEGFGSELRGGQFEDEAGTFELGGLRAGEWNVTVGAEGFGAVQFEVVSVPQETPLEVVLAEEAALAGRVLAPDGAPVEGAKITTRTHSMQEMALAFHGIETSEVKSGAGGSFRLGGLAEGDVTLLADLDGYAPSLPVAVTLGAGEEREDLVVRLREAARITGEVYDKEGRPAAGEGIVAQIPNELDFRQAATDSEGRFVIEDLVPGTWTVMALPNEDRMAQLVGGDGGSLGLLWAGLRMKSVELDEGEEVHVVLGEPPPSPVRVHGRVTLDGDGVAGAVISFAGGETEGATTFQYHSTDAEGRYEVDLPSPGRYVMFVQKVGPYIPESSLEYPCDVPDTDEHEHDVELPLGGISGRVLGGEGEPVAGVRVTLEPARQAPIGHFWGGHNSELTTDEDGRYSITWIPAGDYVLSAGGAPLGGQFGRSSRYARERRQGVRLQEGQQLTRVDFRLELGGEIEGRVLLPDGAPVEKATAFVHASDGQAMDRVSWIETDAAGRFRYGSLEPGTYIVSARFGTQVTGGVEVVVQAGKKSEVGLQLAGGARLSVQTLDANGAPLPAVVRVRDRQGREHQGNHSVTELFTALNNGTILEVLQTIGPLPAGRYEVTAEALDGRRASDSVQLRATRPERRLTLRLE